MILTMEGTMYPSYEDEYGVGIVSEPTHSDEDEAFYIDSILPGWCDEVDADHEGFYGTDESYDEYEADRAQDRWERHFWGD